MAKLEKACIQPLGGSLKNQVYWVLFNPTEYSFDRSNTFKATVIPGLGTPLIQFINGECSQLSMDLFLDDYTDAPDSSAPGGAKSVRQRLDDLTALLDIDRDLHAPPPVRFIWGPLQFDGIIEKMTRKVSLFQPDGTPARATLSVSFKQFRTLKDQMQNPRRESSDKSKRRVVVGRDSLWAIAAREYGDPTQWRLIATENDLDDPRQIEPGDWLILPPLEQTNGTS
jgi:Contractile injection system tube protein